MRTQPLVVLGAGSMGVALLQGALRSGVAASQTTLAADPSEARRQLAHSLGVTTFPGARPALDAGLSMGAEHVLLCVKPQTLPALGAELLGHPLLSRACVTSILAGVTIDALRRSLNAPFVARAMPNLPASIGRGVTALCVGEGVSSHHADFVRAVLRGAGELVEVPERHLDAVTAVAGSGPAYVFHLARAMLDAAVSMGLDSEVAQTLVRQTIAGAGEMLARSDQQPADLQNAVTSPGGTTAAALRVLQDRGVRDAMRDAINAACVRAGELSAIASAKQG